MIENIYGDNEKAILKNFVDMLYLHVQKCTYKVVDIY